MTRKSGNGDATQVMKSLTAIDPGVLKALQGLGVGLIGVGVLSPIVYTFIWAFSWGVVAMGAVASLLGFLAVAPVVAMRGGGVLIDKSGDFIQKLPGGIFKGNKAKDAGQDAHIEKLEAEVKRLAEAYAGPERRSGRRSGVADRR